MTWFYILLALVGVGIGVWWMSQKAKAAPIAMKDRTTVGVVNATRPPGDFTVPLSTAPALATLPHNVTNASMLGL